MDNEERVVRLSKPVKKGLLRLVFSRFCIIALLLVLQIAILIVAYGFFTDKLPVLLSLTRLFAFAMVIYLFNCGMDSSAKLTWMLIISVLPLAGTAFLLFTQSNIGHRMTRKLVDRQIRTSRQFLAQPENVLEKVERDGSGTDDLCRYLNRSGCFPLYDRTAVTYFKLGEDKFKAKAFAPIMPFVASHYNYRDHRKILVIDGKYGKDAARFKALSGAGYDPRMVQQIVNGMLLDD